jgi:predicted Rossmann fold flavoprotein
LVIASGGLSIPKMGATGFGYNIARQFGLKIVETRPGLVPIVLGPKDCEQWCDLTGVSVMAIAKAEPVAPTVAVKKAPAFREKMLFTHRGLSGPAILQASSYWRPGGMIEVDLAPGMEVFTPMIAAKARRDRAAAHTALRAVFSGRLAERWLELHLKEGGDPSSPLSNATITELEHLLHRWAVTPAGTEGYAKAEVTAGGVDTAELDARTMESKRVPGLYFIGEVVDVTGWLGGYNFQWAWASGAAAGRAV